LSIQNVNFRHSYLCPLQHWLIAHPPQVFGGSVYQRVNSQLETGVNLGWTSSNNATNFGIGCKYSLDKDANIRAKINNSSQVGLGYQQKLRDGKKGVDQFLL
jgi:hypothetical protein